MNIIEINFQKLRKSINEYILYNNHEICLCVDTIIRYNKPIILMNSKTLNFFNQKNKQYIINKNKTIPTIFGCYIAIAEWLPFGEVELK